MVRFEALVLRTLGHILHQPHLPEVSLANVGSIHVLGGIHTHLHGSGTGGESYLRLGHGSSSGELVSGSHLMAQIERLNSPLMALHLVGVESDLSLVAPGNRPTCHTHIGHGVIRTLVSVGEFVLDVTDLVLGGVR